jgi:hypothetical protein
MGETSWAEYSGRITVPGTISIVPDSVLFEKTIEGRATVVRSLAIRPDVHGSPFVFSDLVYSH